MNKHAISTIVTIFIVFGAVAFLVAKMYDIGSHRPPLVFQSIPPQALEWANSIVKINPEQLLTASTMGPFDWNNKEDIGQQSTLGKWGKEEDANIIVYYRRDKDATGQLRARNVIQNAESIILDIPTIFGEYPYPEKINGRKVAIYLPNTEEEYVQIISKLGKGTPNISTGVGTSIMEVGPLGVQLKGIVLHPRGFQECSANGAYKYVKAMRREMAHYTYFTSLNFNNDIHQHNWYIDGLSEFFALYEGQIITLPEERIKQIERDCYLEKDFPTRDRLSQWAGASFFEFYANTYGECALSEMVTLSYQLSSDSLFVKLGLSADSLKQEWISYIGSNMSQEYNQ